MFVTVKYTVLWILINQTKTATIYTYTEDCEKEVCTEDKFFYRLIELCAVKVLYCHSNVQVCYLISRWNMPAGLHQFPLGFFNLYRTAWRRQKGRQQHIFQITHFSIIQYCPMIHIQPLNFFSRNLNSIYFIIY
jgi:hypothetical protein